eukprot:gnl/Spiro4/27167_TR13510_c0_g1_i1.p1 gnl/Spiro4/27167_TR13510_c0_g1~~gnl/Spiro4/27167_TR13510_c0_g1_i1.p1  ORF type:complete len:332 (+),score=40.35 gnl/Spiro4/27167_TR13510_c0_g1_i1:28-1023(+)
MKGRDVLGFMFLFLGCFLLARGMNKVELAKVDDVDDGLLEDPTEPPTCDPETLELQHISPNIRAGNALPPPFTTLLTINDKRDLNWRYVVAIPKKGKSFLPNRFRTTSEHVSKQVIHTDMDVGRPAGLDWRKVCDQAPPKRPGGCADMIFTQHVSDCLVVTYFYFPAEGEPRFAMVHYVATGLAHLSDYLGVTSSSRIEHNRGLFEKYLARTLKLKSVSLSDFRFVVTSGTMDLPYSSSVSVSSYSNAASKQLLTLGVECEQIALSPLDRAGDRFGTASVYWDKKEKTFVFGRLIMETPQELRARRKKQKHALFEYVVYEDKWEPCKILTQ